jgi:quercetin dioxygenase-like cupin family protein
MVSLQSLDRVEGEPHADLFPGEEPQTIRLSLDEGEEIAPHQHPDRQIVFHLLSGAVDLTLGEETYELTPGDVARFDGDQYVSPTALTDSEALLVLAPRAD